MLSGFPFYPKQLIEITEINLSQTMNHIFSFSIAFICDCCSSLYFTAFFLFMEMLRYAVS